MRCATARAVVYFVPGDADEALKSRGSMVEDQLVPLERWWASATFSRGHSTAMHQRHISGHEVMRRERLIELGDERGNVRFGDREIIGSARRRRLPRAEERRSAPRHEEEIASRGTPARRSPPAVPGGWSPGSPPAAAER